MRNFFFACFFSVLSAFGLSSCGTHLFDDFFSEKRMVDALQEALYLGSQTAANNLSDSNSVNSSCNKAMTCATGYLGNKLVEIALPDSIKNVLHTISTVSSFLNLGHYGDSIRVAMNRGAEQAAPRSVEVFKNAIFGMSFINAKGILNGDSVAATSYLRNSTYSDLIHAFGPIIKEPLKLLNLNKFWKPISDGHNLLFTNALPSDISEYLAEYATGKALDGLFLMVGKQESKLRADPWGTVSETGLAGSSTGNLLGDVFSKAKDGSL
jgi:hypothetical protein